MPIDAATLASEICAAFHLECSAADLVMLKQRIAFHAKYLGPDGIDELASLLFIECNEYQKSGSQLEIHDISRLLSRVQKRILRFAKKGKLTSLKDFQQPSTSDAEKVKLRELIEELTPAEAVMLDMYYIQGMTLRDIAASTQSSVSTVSRRLRVVLKKLAQD